MALAWLTDAKGPFGREHDAHNDSPFHDPMNTQHGVQANAAYKVEDLTSMPSQGTSTEPMRGTALELRQRRIKQLNGTFNRSSSSPPVVEPDEPVDIPDASAPPLVAPAPDGGPDSDAPELLWTAERLDDLDEHVHVILQSRLQQIEWRLGAIYNRVNYPYGNPNFVDQKYVKRKRYGMSMASSPASSIGRVEPGELVPSPPPPPPKGPE